MASSNIPRLDLLNRSINEYRKVLIGVNTREMYPANDITINVQLVNRVTGAFTQMPTSNITFSNGTVETNPANTTAVPVLSNITLPSTQRPRLDASFTYIEVNPTEEVDILFTYSSTLYPEINGDQVEYTLAPIPVTLTDITTVNNTTRDTNVVIKEVRQTVNGIVTRSNDIGRIIAD